VSKGDIMKIKIESVQVYDYYKLLVKYPKLANYKIEKEKVDVLWRGEYYKMIINIDTIGDLLQLIEDISNNEYRGKLIIGVLDKYFGKPIYTDLYEGDCCLYIYDGYIE
jgi:hypothetical protein